MPGGDVIVVEYRTNGCTIMAPYPVQVNTTAVVALVKSLIGCLLRPFPGLQCDLIRDSISAYGPAAERYISVQQPLTQDSQNPDPNSKSNLERFLLNFLAQRTAQVKHAKAQVSVQATI